MQSLFDGACVRGQNDRKLNSYWARMDLLSLLSLLSSSPVATQRGHPVAVQRAQPIRETLGQILLPARKRQTLLLQIACSFCDSAFSSLFCLPNVRFDSTFHIRTTAFVAKRSRLLEYSVCGASQRMSPLTHSRASTLAVVSRCATPLPIPIMWPSAPTVPPSARHYPCDLDRTIDRRNAPSCCGRASAQRRVGKKKPARCSMHLSAKPAN